MFKTIKNIKLYGDILRFDDIDLSPLKIDPKFVCIAGENGACKTTLIRKIHNTKMIDQIKLDNINSIFIIGDDIHGKIRVDSNPADSVSLDRIINNNFGFAYEKLIDGSNVTNDYLVKRMIIDICKKIRDETHHLMYIACVKKHKDYNKEIQNTF